MTVLATFVVLLVFGPALILASSFLLLSIVGLVAGDGPRIVRKGFRCPFRKQTVTADFLIPAAGAAEPSSVVACSAFGDPRRVLCAKRCLELTEARWTPPVGAFARWALTSAGLIRS